MSLFFENSLPAHAFLLWMAIGLGASTQADNHLMVGASAVDVTPRSLPVRLNGGFVESSADHVSDPLFARSIVVDDGQRKLAIVVVDNCMLPTDLCDRAKHLAAEQTDIRMDQMLISATHTHSAPSVMDYTLGARADPDYTKVLPGKIAEAIRLADARKVPARVGWGKIDAAKFTKNRRWITRSDKLAVDPFDLRTVRAMMHPGHQHPDYVGPAGPIDPWLSLLKIETTDGKPLAALANFSMHYFGGRRGISADYFGLFARQLGQHLTVQATSFVAMMSQGTSGDLWWGDYSLPNDQKPFQSIEEFTDGLVDLTVQVWNDVKCRDNVSLDMAEQRLTIGRRTPNEMRLAWAKRKLQLMGDRRPQDRSEVYAEQAMYLHKYAEEEVVLQVVRIGDLAMIAWPNEVYAITGLKLKHRSPLDMTFNLSLANGACGYIPPPEQHALGGYTTWPARTAGLEVQAEPKMVSAMLSLLERVSEKKRRQYRESESPYSRQIQQSNPEGYFRLGDLSGPYLNNTIDSKIQLRPQGLVAYHLPGREGPQFGSGQHTRAIQLAGGKLITEHMDVPDNYSIEFSFWLGTPVDFRPNTAILLTRGSDQLRISGTGDETTGVLAIGRHRGRTKIKTSTWHHLVFVRNGDFLQVFLDGSERPEISVKTTYQGPPERNLYIGGDSRDTANLEGKLDELSIYGRALVAGQVDQHFRAAGFAGQNVPDDSSKPLSPLRSLQKVHIRKGFRVELVAAEPMVLDPVAIDWGPDGRLWVAEMADYPMGIDGKGEPGGRIRWLADSDGDGQYDKSTVFIEGVSFPNGVLTWGKGVLVTAAPEVFYAEDTDGDGVADQRKTVLSGFVQGNQQLRVNGLRWGLDNWIHCASGGHHAGFGTETSIFVNATQSNVLLGSRDFRFQPEGGFQPQAGPSQFGRVRDDWGNWFGVQNSQPLWHYVLDERYLSRNQDVVTPDSRRQVRTPRMPRIFSAKPPQKRFHGFDQAGHYTSACGISIYRDDLLFNRGTTQQAFTCAPFHNLVQRHILRADGTSWRGERANDGPIDFFASADRWTRPVMTRTGPDGALWIVDMYRFMIEHPEWLPQEGKDELRPNYRSGQKFGRIYRVVPADDESRIVPTLLDASPLELAQLIGHSNGTVRDLAHRRLTNSSDEIRSDAVAELESLVRHHKLPEVRLQALCTLHGLDRLTVELLATCLRDPHHAMRVRAIRIVEFHNEHDALKPTVHQLAEDKSAKIRLQVASTLGNWSDQASGKALVEIAFRSDNDVFTRVAVLSSAGTHYAALVDAVVARPDAASDHFLDGLLVMGLSRRDELARLVRAYIPDDMEQATPLALQRIVRWLNSLHERNLTIEELQKPNDRLAKSLDSLRNLLAQAKGLTEDTNAPLRLRVTAVSFLARNTADSEQDIRLLSNLLAPQQPSELSLASLTSLGRIANPTVATAVLSRFPAMLPTVRSETVNLLLKRPTWTLELLHQFRETDAVAIDWSLSQRQQLLGSRNEAVSQAAHKAFSEDSPSDREQVLQKYQHVVQMVGQSTKGAPLFKQHCQTCHPLDRNKSPVGPDLRTLSSKSPSAILEAILHPSRSIDPRYLNYNIILNNGETLVGIVTSDSGNSLEIAKQDGTRRVILRSSIDAIQSSRLSLMPDGFEQQLTPQDVADVIAFVDNL